MRSDPVVIDAWRGRAANARRAAHTILAIHESSKSRVVILEDLVKKLSGLPVDVRDYFKEATTCLSYDLLRAAVVLSWAGFFHVLTEKLVGEKEKELRRVRRKWKFKTVEELKEKYPESQILDACKDVGLITNAKLKMYQGQLATRNQCAHPTLYIPSLNGALGHVDNMIRQTDEYL